MTAITEAQALAFYRMLYPVRKQAAAIPGIALALKNFDATSGALLTAVGTALTGTTADSFTLASGETDGKFVISVNTTGTNHSVTLKAPVTSQAVTLTLPDVASDTICGIAATQNLTNKTLTTPTIADFTNANHDHSTTAKGGAISTNVTGTTNSTFSVNLGAATPQLDITAAGSTGDFTMTLQVPTIAAARTVTLPAVTCTLASIAGTETLTNKTLTAPALTLPTITDGLHASGSVSNDFSTSTGTFKTSTGAVTIGSGAIGLTGDVTVATNKNVVFTAGTGYLQINGATSGAIKFLPTATGTGTTTIVNVSSAGATITLPSITSTLAILGANTFTGAQTYGGAAIFGSTIDLQGAVSSSTGNPNFDLSGSSGTTKTTTGAVTIGPGAIGVSGDVTIAANKSLTFTGGSGVLTLNGTTNGSIVIDPIDAGTNATTIVNQGGGSAKTITLPAVTGTLAILGANVFTGAQTASGTASWDLSGGNGIFKTPNGGAITIGAGTVAITGVTTFTTMPLIPVATVLAAGSTQADAAPIASGFTLVTNDSANKGIALPTAVAGKWCIVKNNYAGVTKVWPGVGFSDTINGAAPDATMVSGIPALSACMFIAYDSTQWFSIPLVPS